MSIIKTMITEALSSLKSLNYQPLKLIKLRDKQFSNEMYKLYDEARPNTERVAVQRIEDAFEYIQEKMKRNVGLEYLAVDPQCNGSPQSEFSDLYVLGRLLVNNPKMMERFIFANEDPTYKKTIIDLFTKYRASDMLDLIPYIQQVVAANKRYREENGLINNTQKTLQQHQTDMSQANKPKRGRPKKNPEVQKQTFDTYR